MCALVEADRIAALLDLPLGSGNHVLGQHQNMKPLPLIWRSQNIIPNGLFHRSLVRKLEFFIQILYTLFEVLLEELWNQFKRMKNPFGFEFA